MSPEISGQRPATTLRQGLEQTWNWFQKNREEYRKRQNYFAEA